MFSFLKVLAMTIELENETNLGEDSNEGDDSMEKVVFLNNFIAKLMNAPMKMKGNRQTPHVDVSITTEEILNVCSSAVSSFSSQPSLLRILDGALPIHIIGDIHGQFHDLRLIFARCGHPSTTSYLFLGDYVDRGMQGLETATLLMAFQSLYPEKVFMVRGNHEDYNTTLTYGFYDECLMKYGKKGELVWLNLINVFNHIPFAATVVNKILCLHGGISPHMKTIDDIDTISRPTFIPAFGLACDLVWSDPEISPNCGYALSARGISFSFDDTTIEHFCLRNNIDVIIRAHQITSEMYHGGHKFHCNGRMITIFSAPNYLGMENDSCVVRIDEQKSLKFIVFRPEKNIKKIK
ncbi:unnamed protein product [Caenorhabditis bovis]|uniref:Serine/threonine-protein phosphatase n=1 Tax=Caenorhabditis bovis TaxID=2654633 RepID=A0A8S1E659_9PELO|nr:unnamed protein product [Caenorhabditis bovis]